jgi:hypothetical protein
VPDLAGQQNGSRTGTEYGLLPAKLKKGFKEPTALEELEHGGRFAARKNEAIKPGKLFGVADLDGLGAGICERPSVGGVIPLKGEYADARAESLWRRRNCCCEFGVLILQLNRLPTRPGFPGLGHTFLMGTA